MSRYPKTGRLSYFTIGSGILLPHFEKEVQVTYYGGVFQNIIFKQAFCYQLLDCQFTEPIHNALVGAYIFAKKSHF